MTVPETIMQIFIALLKIAVTQSRLAIVTGSADFDRWDAYTLIYGPSATGVTRYRSRATAGYRN